MLAAGTLIEEVNLEEDTLNDATVTVTLVNTEYVGTPNTANFSADH